MGMRKLLVLGAGPAGLTAAAVAARHGLAVTVLDESLEPGGRLAGQLHEGANGQWWRGPDMARELAAEVRDAGADIRVGHSVWAVQDGFHVYCNTPAGPEKFAADYVLLATGAAEKPLPVPGWTLPGAISIGAAQVMVNVHRVRPGRRVLVIGIDALGVSIARALQLAGVEVVGVVNPPPGVVAGKRAVPVDNLVALSGAARAAGPGMALRLAGGLVANRRAAGFALRALPRGLVRVWDIPVYFSLAALEIRGKEQVEEAVLAPVSPDGAVDVAKAYIESVDAVCLAGGLTPLAELAFAAGCQFTYIPDLGGQVPLTGPEQQTTVPGIWAAGAITGVESAQVAMEQGRIAGFAIAKAAGALAPEVADKAMADIRSQLEAYRATSGTMINPRVKEGRELLARRWAEHWAAAGSHSGNNGQR